MKYNAEKIKENVSIVELVQSYGIEIKNNKIKCPFHADNDPSMQLFPNKKTEKGNDFFCYGCHKGGNTIEFVKLMENTDYDGACEKLVQNFNIVGATSDTKQNAINFIELGKVNHLLKDWSEKAYKILSVYVQHTTDDNGKAEVTEWLDILLKGSVKAKQNFYIEHSENNDITIWLEFLPKDIDTVTEFEKIQIPEHFEPIHINETDISFYRKFKKIQKETNGFYAPVSADERALQELQFDETGKLTIHNLETYLKLMNISVKYNDITHKLSISGVDQKESNDHINENIIPLIYDTMQHEFKKCNVNMIKQFLEVIATRNRFNPVIDMLNGVKWDGIDRLEQVYNMFQIDQEDELSRILLKKWFMQCICGLHNTDSDSPFSLDIVLIFQGQQGAGKTRFFEHIAMNKKLFGEGVIIDPRNKDTHIQATSRWICELGEIGTTMRKDVDSLKAFLTLSSDTYRKPYGHTDLEYNRMTSFCGTTNDERFLIDETGNRRFATIPLKSDLYIDYDAQVKTFDSLQFWSQIAELVETEIKKNNKSYASVFRLTREELIQLNERNREFEKPLKGEEEVTDVLCSLEMMKQDKTKNVVIEYMTVTEFISQHTELKGLNSRQVGKVLDKLGYPMIKKKINGTVQRVRELPRFKGIANYPEYN